MPHVLGPKYLRVRTPRTIDGINLAFTEDRREIYDEMDLPLSAEKHLNRLNSKLPHQLRAQIIHIDEDKAPDPALMVKGAGVIMLSNEQRKAALLKQLEELEADEKTEEIPVKLKPGQHKPKAKATADDLV